MLVNKLVGRWDMFIDQHLKLDMRWVRTRQMRETPDSKLELVVKLEPCEVDDPNRVGYLDGSWYRLEQAAFEQHKPLTSEDAKSFVMTEVEDELNRVSWARLVEDMVSGAMEQGPTTFTTA